MMLTTLPSIFTCYGTMSVPWRPFDDEWSISEQLTLQLEATPMFHHQLSLSNNYWKQQVCYNRLIMSGQYITTNTPVPTYTTSVSQVFAVKNQTVIIVRLYYLLPQTRLLRVSTALDDRSHSIEIRTKLSKEPDTFLFKFPEEDQAIELFDHLVATSSDLEPLVIESTKTTRVEETATYRILITN